MQLGHAPLPTSKRCNKLFVVLMAVFLAYGTAVYFVPSFGPPAMVEVKAAIWTTPWLPLIAASFIVAQAVYLIWCNGFLPGNLHPSRVTATMCEFIAAYLYAFAVSVWVAGIGVTGAAFVAIGSALAGWSFLVTAVFGAALFCFLASRVRAAMNKAS
jgi:hypothetical protein